MKRERTLGTTRLAEAKSRAKRENKWNAEERVRRALVEKEKWEAKSADSRRVVEELTIEIEQTKSRMKLDTETYHPLYYCSPSIIECIPESRSTHSTPKSQQKSPSKSTTTSSTWMLNTLSSPVGTSTSELKTADPPTGTLE